MEMLFVFVWRKCVPQKVLDLSRHIGNNNIVSKAHGTKGYEMTIDHDDFLRVRDNIIERFDECDEKSYDSLSECVDESLIYNADILAVIVELMPTSDAINGYTLAALAYDLMYDYVLENGYVECIDD